VNFPAGMVQAGDFIDIEITEALPNSLRGRCVPGEVPGNAQAAGA